MQYKKSNYTYYVESEESVILYHALTKKMGIIHDKASFYSILNNQERDSGLYKQLVQDLFWIEEDVNEFELAKMNFFEEKFSSILSLTILPTLQCNFRCEYCYEDFKNLRMNEQCINDLIKYIKFNMKSFAMLKVDWFGGEPLLEIDTINILSKHFIEICHQLRKPYLSSMTTNGFLLTPSVFEQMIHNRIRTFQITLDGMKETHDKARHLVDGRQTFDVILKNLKEIKKSCQSYFNMVIRVNVTDSIYQNLEECLDFFDKEFGDDRRFTFLLRPVGDWGGTRIEKFKGELVGGMHKIYKKMLEASISLDHRVYFELLTDAMCETAKRNSYVIKPDGSIGKCTMYLDDKENEVGILKNGKIIWNNERLSRWICQGMDIAQKCNKCALFPSCKGSTCPASGVIQHKKLQCGYENTYIDKILLLLAKDAGRYKFIKTYN